MEPLSEDVKYRLGEKLVKFFANISYISETVKIGLLVVPYLLWVR